MAVQGWLQHPYIRLMRLHRPVGIWLLMWPCWWSYVINAGFHIQMHVLLLLMLGAVVMRSAGCVINDLVDREIDKQVERTKMRPLASGEISVAQAKMLLGFLLAGGATIALLLGPAVLFWSMLVLPLIFSYPMMKRYTWWPQVFLGVTFNWGVFIGSVVATGGITASAVLLYLGCILWTIGYDTIYAHQDKKDDHRIGMRSTALRLGAATRHWLFGLYGCAVLLFVAAGVSATLALPYYFGMAVVSAHLAWQAVSVNFNNPASCMHVFTSNVQTGLLMLVACLLGVFL